MKKICKILGITVNVIGCIITGIVVWILGSSISSSPYFEALVKGNILATILIFIGVILLTLLPTVIVGVVLIGFGEMLEYQEFIAEKVLRLEVILKNKVIGEQNSSNEEKKEKTTEKSLMWKCPKCG